LIYSLRCHTIFGLTTPVKIAQGFRREHVFNQLVATTANALEFSVVGKNVDSTLTNEPTQADVDACVPFGNGDSIPLEPLMNANQQIYEEHATDIQWQKGDIALINNYLMAHSRHPWSGQEGSCKLLVSLVHQEEYTSFAKN
jgi:hypothetical protein